MLDVSGEFFADVNPAFGGSSTSWFEELNGATYFVTSRMNVGDQQKLWSTDGTPEGTHLVTEISKRVADDLGPSRPPVVQFDNRLFFVVTDQDGKNQRLWSTDGTAEGTGEFSSVPISFQYNGLFVAGDRLYFAADDAAAGRELWETDGTVAGTHVVADLVPGASGSEAEPLFAAGDKLYFSAKTPAAGRELWATDGVTTEMLRDFVPGPSNTGQTVANGVDLNGLAIFSALDGNQWKLWRSDGTAAGTSLVQSPGSIAPEQPTFGEVFDGRVYFTTLRILPPATAVVGDLWVTDGTDAGTFRLKEFPVNPSYGLPPDFEVVGDRLYIGVGNDLWVTEGTENSTVLVKELAPDPSQAFVRELVDLNGTLYFLNSVTFWTSDGTEVGTEKIDSFPTTNSIEVIAGKIYFSAATPTVPGTPFSSDGTTEGTQILGVFNTDPVDGNPGPFVNVNGTLYFTAEVSGSHKALWKTDGTSAETTQLLVAPEAITGLQNIGGQLSFIAFDGNGPQFWTTDGTPEGTHPVTQIDLLAWNLTWNYVQPPAGNDVLVAPQLYVAGDHRLFMLQEQSESGDGDWAIWQLDNSPTGASLVMNLGVSSGPYAMTTADNKLYFLIRRGGAEAAELWESDGTPEGTHSIATSYDRELMSVGGDLFYRYPKAPGDPDNRLTRFDPATGTATELDWPGFISPKEFQGAIYFGNGNELWRTDNSPLGASLVAALPADGVDYSISRLEIAGGSLYLVAHTSDFHSSLWISDGTAAGTHKVDDFVWILDDDEFQTLSQGAMFQDVDGRLAFIAYPDVESQPCIYVTNGTSAGTYRVSDPLDDNVYSNYLTLGSLNGALYFSAPDPTYGDELFRLAPSEPGDSNYDGVVDGTDNTVWADHFLRPGDWGFAQGDFNRDGVVNGADYVVWADHFSVAPASPPAAAAVAATTASTATNPTPAIVASTAFQAVETASTTPAARADEFQQRPEGAGLASLHWAATVDRLFAQASARDDAGGDVFGANLLDWLRRRRGG